MSAGLEKKVRDVMTSKVMTVKRSDSVSKAVELMKSRNIGSVVVVEKGLVVGIITERDVITKVLGEGREPSSAVVEDVMSVDPVMVDSDLPIFEAAKLMVEGKFRRLPVVEAGKLKGIVTETDLSNAMRSAAIDVTPRLEDYVSSLPSEYQLDPGKSYLFEERKPMKCYEVFVDLVKHGYAGLCISRTNPSVIRKMHGISATPMVWVTDIKTSEPTIDPKDLVGVSKMVSEFVEKAKNGVVFIEALTYLIGHNDFNGVLNIVQHIRDKVSDSNSSLIIYADPIVLSERELEMLMQEMDEVKFRAY
ncbi:MAG: DUF835 domain-containing protein [Candidatus Altiarchaeales archaeon]|nr:DUF835 domain-containing protein [Candidatus Altiarchaeales archaeon]MBD3415915.1 DUF835 domain-containing protein [Candidatus Altiarchaeales archaeon]